MGKSRVTLALSAVSLIVAACNSGSASTTEALLPTSAATVSVLPTPSSETTRASETLVDAGCEVFDADALGRLTPISNALQLVESAGDAGNLTCNFVGTGGGLDTGVRIEVDSISSHPEGHFTTPGQVESAITVADRPGVGSGRGTLRIRLDETRGMTLEVTIRAIGSAGVLPRDGEYLDIRDTIAMYVISALNQ